MELGTLGAALEREHREIDSGIEEFTAARRDGRRPAEPLRRAIDGLRRHIYLEEEFLFPPMRSTLAIPISVMLREHGEIWRTLDSLDRQLASGEPTDATAETCRGLLAQLDAHNAKEEPIFYTQADSALTTAQAERLERLIASGELPSGWVCQVAAVG